MARQRLVEYHLGRLKDKRAEVRIEAINELLQLDAVEALDTLQELYRNDPDAEVKKAAQSAGRTLFLKSRQQSSESQA
ncbi:MAG: HEAT repeat domain-containing protein [Anaerolineae bacterium]|nr:HEAT repeat domain-containing protein [Anaerolineae bacterium]MDW8173273.1 HEAT repeat domain-containing protein [Anaerolineae bacterium]